MSDIVFAIPGDIDLPTGGYGYDRRLLAEWRETGIAARHLALPGSFPAPIPTDLAETERLLMSLAPETTVLIDGLAYGAFPESLARALAGRVVALVHHPLALETGLAPLQAAALAAGETAALAHAGAVVVTSPLTQRILVADFGVAAERITIAVPGVDPAPRARGSGSDGPLALLAVGSLIPRKGYDVLIAALAGLEGRDWRLTIIGAQHLAPATTQAIRQQIAAARLEDRILLAGPRTMSELADAYDAADLFVMPSLFEGYGMVLTEALARGLPILCTTGGAAAETVPDATALKVPPGDVAALNAALAELLDDAGKRALMAEAAWAAADSLPRWQETAERVARACRKVIR